MAEQALQAQVLNPWQTMPKGIKFETSLTEAVMAVVTRQVYAALWRPPEAKSLVDICSGCVFPDGVAVRGEKPIPAEIVFTKVPSVRNLFGLVSEALSGHYPPHTHELHTAFKYCYTGASDILHRDTIGNNIQALITLKGQGTWVVSPDEAKAAGSDQFWVKGSNSIEDAPAPLLHQVATGDVIIWRNDFPHAGFCVVRPEDERLLGLVVTGKKKTAPIVA